jgi:hypothetical protein
MRGHDSIKSERKAQMGVHKYYAENDNAWVDGELTKAANCYLRAAEIQRVEQELTVEEVKQKVESFWPWDLKPLKLSKFRSKNLIKAGAMIAAELDRLFRARAKNG